MSNGGSLYSCLTCRWVQTNPDVEQSWKQARCQRHSMDVIRPGNTFCSDLSIMSLPKIFSWLIKGSRFRGKDVYSLIEIQYRTQEYPNLPQYHLEIALLAPIKTYASWSEDQKREARSKLYEQKEKEFRQKYGGNDS